MKLLDFNIKGKFGKSLRLVKEKQGEEAYKALYRMGLIKNARESFWWYCQSRESDFYTDDKKYLKEYCDTLQAFAEDRIVKWDEDGEWEILTHEEILKKEEELGRKALICYDLMINMPPQHGKSRTLVNFTQWMLGKDNEQRIITGSYGDDPATDFATYTRDGIQAQRDVEDKDGIVFQDIFPKTKVKKGSAAAQKWALDGQHFNYLGVGRGGAVTGKGATWLIADDLIKDAEEALNANILAKTWRWYTITFKSRIAAKDGNVKSILNMTMWSKQDPAGRIWHNPELKKDWYRLAFKAYDKEKDEMLCERVLSKKAYLKKYKEAASGSKLDLAIFLANYQQEIFDTEGALYQNFKTYKELPKSVRKRKVYVDTADTGKDYLCSIVYDEDIGGEFAYLVDVIYTQKPMTVTEEIVAEQFCRYQIDEADIEGNNGGSNFARAVEKIIKKDYGYKCVIESFRQSKNKETRIHSNASAVQKYLLFPENWENKFPEFYEAMATYQAQGKNAHDDGPDTATGVVEKMGFGSKGSIAEIFMRWKKR